MVVVSDRRSRGCVQGTFGFKMSSCVDEPFSDGIMCRHMFGAVGLCTGREELVSVMSSRVRRGRGGGRVVIRILDRVVRFHGKRDNLRIIRVGALAELLLRELIRGASTCGLAPSSYCLVSATSTFRSVNGIKVSRSVLGGPKGLARRRFRAVGRRALVNTSVLSGLRRCGSRGVVGVTCRVYE